MTSVVFFRDLGQCDEALSHFSLQIFKGLRVAVKMHMGEPGNQFFPQPSLVKPMVAALQGAGASPFLTDTTVAYAGPRRTKEGYLATAKKHGFTLGNVGCEVIIDDTGVPTRVEGRVYEVAAQLKEAQAIVGVSHVKGHIQTGMGGAIKNFGMGGVTRESKIAMHHGSRPVYRKDACTYCGVCAEMCPFEAITVEQGSWSRDKDACFGCGVCVDTCKQKALSYQDADLQFLLACSAKACLDGKPGLFLNEMKRIARGCDCDPGAGPVICPDVGYVLGVDPVAVDAASLDLIDRVKPGVFEKVNRINPRKQIKYGEEIGLGSSSYSLIEL
jgi:uncharacterized Fe-S center protein